MRPTAEFHQAALRSTACAQGENEFLHGRSRAEFQDDGDFPSQFVHASTVEQHFVRMAQRPVNAQFVGDDRQTTLLLHREHLDRHG